MIFLLICSSLCMLLLLHFIFLLLYSLVFIALFYIVMFVSVRGVAVTLPYLPVRDACCYRCYVVFHCWVVDYFGCYIVGIMTVPLLFDAVLFLLPLLILLLMPLLRYRSDVVVHYVLVDTLSCRFPDCSADAVF